MEIPKVRDVEASRPSRRASFASRSNWNDSIDHPFVGERENNKFELSLRQCKASINKIENFMAFSSFEFVNQAPAKEQKSINCELKNYEDNETERAYNYKIKNPFRILKRLTRCRLVKSANVNCLEQSSTQFFNELYDFGIFVYSICYAFILVISAIIISWHDKLIESYMPKIRSGANRTEQCALKSDIHFGAKLEQREELLEDLSYSFEFLGQPYALLSYASSCYYSIVATFIFIKYLFGFILLHSRQTPVGFLNFIFNPVDERQRIRNELSRVIHYIVRCSLDNENSPPFKLKSLKNDTLARLYQSYDSKFRAYHCSRSRSQQAVDNNEFNANRKFARMLLDQRFSVEICPANLSLEWHQKQINSMASTLTYARNNNYGVGIILLNITLTNVVLYYRTEQRLSLIKCQQWNPNATSIKYSYAHLDELGSSEDMRAYLTYDEAFSSALDLIKLIFLVEAKSYFSLRRIAYFLFHIVGTVIASTQSTYYLAFFVHLHNDKLIWLEQITSQVDDCISRMSYIRYQYLSRKKSSKNAVSSLDNDLDNIMILVTRTYLNFEIFRRKQERYKKIADPMLLQEAAHCLSSLFCCYYFSPQHSNNINSGFFMFGSAFVVMTANFYLTLGALLTSRMDKLMKRIAFMVAISVQVSAQTKRPIYAISLWRRQLTSEQNLKKLLAPNIFGMHLSHGKLVNLNLYLLALWFMLARIKV